MASPAEKNNLQRGKPRHLCVILVLIMKEGNRIVPDGPGDIIIQEEIERQKEIDKKLDPRILAIKKRQEQILKDSEVHQADLELEFTI